MSMLTDFVSNTKDFIMGKLTLPPSILTFNLSLIHI